MQRLEVLARQLTAGKLAGEHVAAATTLFRAVCCPALIVPPQCFSCLLCMIMLWSLGFALKPTHELVPTEALTALAAGR